LSQQATQATGITLFVPVLIGVAAAWIVSWAMLNLRQFSLNTLDARVMERLGSYAFERLIGHSHDFFSSNFAGALTHKVGKFGRAYEALADSLIMTFLPAILFIVGAITILCMNNVVVGLILLIWVVTNISVQVVFARRREPLRVERSESDTRVTATLADAVSNHATIQLFAGTSHERALVQKTFARWRAITRRVWNYDTVIWSIGTFLMVGIQIITLVVALHYWSLGQFTVGDFVLIQLYLFGTFNRLGNINNELRRVYDSYYDAAEMVEILNTPYSVQNKTDAPALQVSNGEIVFDDVEFHFHANRSVLEHFDLCIPGGQKTALVGLSGAGKSTITKLLLRLYDVTGGAVRIDGQNVSDVTQDSLRSMIGFVPQEPILFHRTLKDNIRYGRRDATDEEVIEAAKKAHCHEFISKLNLGYDTYVGERGIKLSGGERQRVAIARAILKNAPILVLDEATSSLDSESEAFIQDALQTLMQGKTVVVIAHRLSTIMKMDRIIVLDNGRVVADGTHDALLAEDGLYKKLWSIQAGGFLKDEDTVDGIKESRCD
jgi:ATP-binding cassette, subfamily B, bacterial